MSPSSLSPDSKQRPASASAVESSLSDSGISASKGCPQNRENRGLSIESGAREARHPGCLRLTRLPVRPRDVVHLQDCKTWRMRQKRKQKRRKKQANVVNRFSTLELI